MVINIPVNIRVPDYYFRKMANVIIYNEGDRSEAIDSKGNLIVRDTHANVLKKVFSYLGSKGGTIFLDKGEYDIDKMLVPAPWPNDMIGTIRIIGAGIDNTIIRAASDNALPTYGALFGYGYSGINPTIKRVEFCCLTIDGGYGETTTGPRNTALINTGEERVLVNVKLTRSPGFTLFMASSKYYLENVVFEETGQPDASTHMDIIGGGSASGVVIGCRYINSAGNYLDHVNPGPVIFIGNISENHEIGGFYGCGGRCVVAFNVLRNNNSGSGIGTDSQTTNKVAPNIVAFNSLENIVVNKPPCCNGDIYIDEHGALHLPPPPRDHYKMLDIAGVGGLSRGGGGSQMSIEGGAYGIEIWNAGVSQQIALMRYDSYGVNIYRKVNRIGIPLLSDCSDLPSSGSYDGEAYVCYDSSSSTWKLKVWNSSAGAWETIG